MNKLNKNRIIGGSVIILAALIFVPAILTPKQSSVANPTLTVSTKPDNAVSRTQVITLANPVEASAENSSSNGKVSVTSTNDKTSNNTKIQLESANNKATITTTQKPIIANTKITKWLRVGSFSSEDNANKALKELQAYHPVTEVVRVGNKNYHRVLIGPFVSDEKLEKAKKQLIEKGYKDTTKY